MVIAAAIAVCQENKDESNCFHTGVAFCPAAIKRSYSFLAEATTSVNIGILLLIARKKICGPIARAGSSLAICCKLILTLFSLGAGSSATKGVELVCFFCFSYCSSCSFNLLITPVSACTSAKSLSLTIPVFPDSLVICPFNAFSSASSRAMATSIYLDRPSILPSTERIPVKVLSSSIISSLTGSITTTLILFDNIQS